MFKYIIFDVDGTILDTENAILKSLQKVLTEEGEHYSTDDLRIALGIPGRDTLKKLNINDVERVHAKWSQMLLDFSDEVHIFQGIKESVEQLAVRPIQLGIVTSKTAQQVEEEFHPFGLSHFFDSIVSASDTTHHKPHPDPLLHCLKEFGAQPEEAVYIGDSIYDIKVRA